ncbi:MAG: hypothetical protein Q7R95_04030 [bacterium]|nr:hypothetical protein [bacterium]
MECLNNNSFDHLENHKIGCVQDCTDCEYNSENQKKEIEPKVEEKVDNSQI